MSNIVPLIPPANQFVPEDQVTTKRLCELLDAVLFEHVLEEQGDIYVTDGVEIPLWIHIKPEAKLIALITCYDAETGIPSTTINKFNASIILPQFSIEGTVLWGRYWLTYDGGLNVRALHQDDAKVQRGVSNGRRGIAP